LSVPVLSRLLVAKKTRRPTFLQWATTEPKTGQGLASLSTPPRKGGREKIHAEKRTRKPAHKEPIFPFSHHHGRRMLWPQNPEGFLEGPTRGRKTRAPLSRRNGNRGSNPAAAPRGPKSPRTSSLLSYGVRIALKGSPQKRRRAQGKPPLAFPPEEGRREPVSHQTPGPSP